MTESFEFTTAGGRKVVATLTIGDLRKIAFAMTQRAIVQERSVVKTLGGNITLVVEGASA